MNVLMEGLGGETGLWSPDAEEITTSYSAIQLHRKCPEAWYFRSLGLKRPILGPAPYLHFGSWFGTMRTAEALVRGRRMDSLVLPPRKYEPIDDWAKFDQATMTPKLVLEQAVAWWKVQAQDPLVVDEWHDKIGADLPTQLRNVFMRWMDEWGEASKKEKPLALEMFWKRELPRPRDDLAWADGRTDLPKVVLLGFIDQVYEDTDRGLVIVRDDKTSSKMSSMTSSDDLMDSQLQFYAWGATPALERLGVAAPRAISYDRTLSTKPADPKLNLNGTLSASSKNYPLRGYRQWLKVDTRPESVEELKALAIENAGKNVEDWDGFSPDQQAVMLDLFNQEPGRVFGKIGVFTGDVPKFGIYREDPTVVARLSSPDHRSMFHQRTMTPINQNIVRAHLRAAVDTVTDIWRTQQRAEITFEAPRNMSKDACRWCDFLAICRAQMFGGSDGEYDLREFGLRHKSGKVVLERGVVRDRDGDQDEEATDADPS